MLVRLMGATSNPSSAWFSSSSWKARLSASIAANVNVTHRMLGARSIAATAVGSRPKLNTTNTSAVKTRAESSAVRVRNSRIRSLRAIVQASRSSSPTGHRLPVLVGDQRRRPGAARRAVHQSPPEEERDVGRQLDPLLHVVRGEDEDAAAPHERGEDAAELCGGREVEPRERLVEEQHR